MVNGVRNTKSTLLNFAPEEIDDSVIVTIQFPLGFCGLKVEKGWNDL